MPSVDRIFRRIAGSPALISLAIYALPWLALTVLGVLWLAEKEWLIQFVAGTLGLVLLLRAALWLARWRSRRPLTDTQIAAVEPLVEANPEWTEREVSVYRSLCADIPRSPIPWDGLRPVAFTIIEQAAQHLSGGKKGALDFSIPEALLLADRVLLRLRRDMQDKIPFSDRVSIKTLIWLWENKGWFQQGATVISWAWRAKRLATNAPAAILQEIQGAMTSGADAGELKNFSTSIAQKIILEEIARAAIDLHSGYLRFSDEELLKIELGSVEVDTRSLPQPDEPIRLLVIGQVSAGKSTLVNRLVKIAVAETDMAPTTSALARYDAKIETIPYSIIDTQGIDGSTTRSDALLAQAMQCDQILWVIRSNRPARAPDLALLKRIEASYAARPDRRVPPMHFVASAIDQILPDWPYAENFLPEKAQATVAEATSAIAADLMQREVIPVCAEAVEWNVELCVAAIANGAAEALATQRNRRRIEGVESHVGITREISRGLNGAIGTGRLVVDKLWRKD